MGREGFGGGEGGMVEVDRGDGWAAKDQFLFWGSCVLSKIITD